MSGSRVGCKERTNPGAVRDIRSVGYDVPAGGLLGKSGLASCLVDVRTLLMCASSLLVNPPDISSFTLSSFLRAVLGDVPRLIARIAYSVIICCCHHGCPHRAYCVLADGVVRGQVVSHLVQECCDAIRDCRLGLT